MLTQGCLHPPVRSLLAVPGASAVESASDSQRALLPSGSFSCSWYTGKTTHIFWPGATASCRAGAQALRSPALSALADGPPPGCMGRAQSEAHRAQQKEKLERVAFLQQKKCTKGRGSSHSADGIGETHSEPARAESAQGRGRGEGAKQGPQGAAGWLAGGRVSLAAADGEEPLGPL